jgi:ABC-type dipeptide/oligopeptide/nickel transport system permease component
MPAIMSEKLYWGRYLAWLTKTLLGFLSLFLVVLTITFGAFKAIPSDPVRNALGMNASEAAVDRLREHLGFNDPLGRQYLRFLGDTLRLEFGTSWRTGQQVTPMVSQALTTTLANALIAIFASAMISLILIWVAQRGSSMESRVLLVVRSLTSIPSLIVSIAIGLVILLGFGTLGGFRSGTSVGLIVALCIYPSCSLAEVGLLQAQIARRLTFVLVARSYGRSESTIFWRYVLRGILSAWLGQLSNIAGVILVASALMEAVYGFPGLGYLLSRSLAFGDLPVLQALVIVLVSGFLSLDLLFERILLPRVALHETVAQ